MSDAKKNGSKPVEEQKAPAHPCPICRSAGREYSRRRIRLYLKCNGCGHTWSETPGPDGVEVAYRTVEIQKR